MLLVLVNFVGLVPSASVAQAHGSCFAYAGQPIPVDATHDRVNGSASCTAHPKVRIILHFQLYQSSGWSTIWSQTKVCDKAGDDTGCAIDTIPQPGWGGLCQGSRRTWASAAAYGAQLGWHATNTQFSTVRSPSC